MTRSNTSSPERGSRIKDLLKFLSSVQGDLSNVTAPPLFLAPTSVVEVGHCWAQHPAIFSAPAFEPSPERRALLVLQHILTSLQSQLYIAGSPDVSIKKPLNAFLGELFLAKWTDKETGRTTRLVSEQVSHHPPITAMHIADEENGVRADGYARVEMGFSGNVDIKQIGHAVLHVDKYDENYLIPLPDVRVRGFMGGKLYPEVNGTYHVVGSNGYVSEIKFSGAGFAWGGSKNSFTARLYHKADPSLTLYSASGCWSSDWTIKDARTGNVIEKYDLNAPENAPAEMEIAPLEEQDPWESRRAWASVRDAISRGDYAAIVKEKTKVEQAQRDMRASEKERGKAWKPLLFKSMPGSAYEVFRDLSDGFEWPLQQEKTKGVWRVDGVRLLEMQRPFKRELTPVGLSDSD